MVSNRPRQPALSSNRGLKLSLPGAVLLFTLFRFFLNVKSLPALYFRDDEWYTLLAGVRILQYGIPRFPSGFLYNHGILYSYVEALLFLIMGFNEVLGRWPSLWLSTLTLPVAYSITRRASRTGLASLIVVGILLLDPVAVEWGAKARMTAMTQLLVWLLLYVGWQVSQKWYDRRQHGLLYVVASLGLLCHLLTSFQIIAVSLAIMAVIFLKTRRTFFRQWRGLSWIDGAGFLLVGGVLFWLSQSSRAFQLGPNASVSPSIGFERLKLIWDWSISGGDQKIARLTLLPAALGYAFMLLRPVAREYWPRQKVLLFLGIDFAISSALFFFVSNPLRWHPKYASSILLPPFAMFMAIGIEAVIKNPIRSVIGRIGAIADEAKDRIVVVVEAAGFFILFFLAMINMQEGVFPYLDPSMDRISYPPGHPYKQAFEYVRANWQEGDKVATIYSATCELYFDHCDLYPNQTYPNVIKRDGKLVDIWVGSLWLPSLSDIKRELEAPGILWFVGDTGESFDAASLEYGMKRTERTFHSAFVTVWRER